MIYLTIQSVSVAFISLLFSLFFFVVACVAVRRMMQADQRTRKIGELSSAKDELFQELLVSKDNEIKKVHAAIHAEREAWAKKEAELTSRRLKVTSRKR